MRMLNYTGKDTYDSSIVKQASDAIIMLDLSEKSFMLALSADIERAYGQGYLANHPFYKGYITVSS